MTERIKSWLPILSILVASLGIIKIYFYYELFGISIFNFIGLSEITTYIIEDLIIAIPLAGGWFIIEETDILNPWRHVTEPRKPPTQNQINGGNWFFIISWCLVVAFSVFINIVVFSPITIIACLYFIIMATSGVIFQVFSKAKLVKLITPTHRRLLFYGIFILFITLTRSAWSYQKAWRTMADVKTNSGKFYRCYKDTIFVGKTEKYFFIKAGDMIDVIPEASVVDYKIYRR
jgi:hypothetical protein